MKESKEGLNVISRRMLRFTAEKVFVSTKRILKKLDSPLIDGDENKIPATHKHIDMPGNLKQCVPHFEDNAELSPYSIVIWESELQFMAGLANKWGNTEIGGELYGLITPNNELIVMYVTPPGPNAMHGHAHFRPDIPFLTKANVFLRDNFGLFYCGNYHNHHSLGLKAPSVGDVESTQTIAQKNQFKMMWQIITNFQDTASLDNQYEDKRTIEINAFCYTEESNWQPKRCEIEILSGMSPLRTAINSEVWRKNTLPELLVHYVFSSDHIYNAPIQNNLHQNRNISDDEPHNLLIPQSIHKSIQKLPDNIRKIAQIDFKEEFIIVILTILKQEARIYIAHKKEPPHDMVAVYLIDVQADKGLINFTDQVLSSKHDPDFLEIYIMAQKIHIANTEE